MATIDIDNYPGKSTLRLFLNRAGVGEIGLSETIPLGVDSYVLTRLSGSRIHRLYLNTNGVFTLFTGYKVVGNKIVFDSPQAKPILCVSLDALSLQQLNLTSGEVVKIYPRATGIFTYKNVRVRTVNEISGLAGPYLFSPTGLKNSWLSDITFASLPTLIYVKSTVPTVGTLDTIPLIITADTYL